MTIAHKTTRRAAGCYRVGAGPDYVTVNLEELRDGWHWVARASWDKFLVTDPLRTKREAVAAAHEMLSGEPTNGAGRCA